MNWLDVHSGSVIAGATVLLVLITAAYVLLTTRMVRATNQLAQETVEDRELSVRPVVVCIAATLGTATRPDGGSYRAPAVLIRNIGNGPAINGVIWGCWEGKTFASRHITLAIGEVYPHEPANPFEPAFEPQALECVADDSGRDVVGVTNDTNLYAYCGDQLGTRLRFNLRRSIEPPQVWRRGEPAPRWAHAWSAAGAE